MFQPPCSFFLCSCQLLDLYRSLIILKAFQSSTDVPLLVELNTIARRVLLSIHAAGTPQSSPMNSASSQAAINSPSLDSQIRVGFITPPFKDNRIPITDHLHAHAYIAPNDLCGWWRSISYGSLGWYAIEDLIAEIR